ncbi:MAG: hypothetical protein ABIK28_04465 [Planctomycetota bacterium]
MANDDPMTLLRGNAFSQAVFAGTFMVEGVNARKAVVTEALSLIDHEVIPLLTADASSVLDVLGPDIVVDASYTFMKSGLRVGDASVVIGVGSGFMAGEDCDVVINATPGFDMGRLLYRGSAPGPSLPDTIKREKITADTGGLFMPRKRLGQKVEKGEIIALAGDGEIRCGSAGVISAQLQEGLEIYEGTIVAEVDLRGKEDYGFLISDWDRAISGGVLEVAAAWIADVGAFA